MISIDALYAILTWEWRRTQNKIYLQFYRFVLFAFGIAALFTSAASAQSSASSSCKYSRYSFQFIASDSEQGFRIVKRFTDATLPSLLKSIFSDSSPLQTDPPKADVTIYYVLSSYRYKVLRHPITKKLRHTTILNLLETIPEISQGRTLSSPWVQISDQPNCKLSIAVLWNKRQFIADQAILHGVELVQKGIVTPQNDPSTYYLPKEYDRLVTRLDEFETMFPDEVIATKSSPELRRQQELVISAVKDRFPPEVLWWFSRIDSNKYWAGSVEFFSQLASNEEKLANHVASKQAALLSALVSRFLSEAQEKEVINSILDLGSLIDLDDYKM